MRFRQEIANEVMLFVSHAPSPLLVVVYPRGIATYLANANIFQRGTGEALETRFVHRATTPLNTGE